MDIFIGPFYGDKGITGLGEKFTWKKKVLYRGEFIDGEKSDKGEENSNEWNFVYGKQQGKNILEIIKMDLCMVKDYMNGVKENFIEGISLFILKNIILKIYLIYWYFLKNGWEKYFSQFILSKLGITTNFVIKSFKSSSFGFLKFSRFFKGFKKLK